MTQEDSQEHKYGLVAVKRRWVPDRLFALFGYDSGIWGLQNAAIYQPWRWILTRPATKFEQRKADRPRKEKP